MVRKLIIEAVLATDMSNHFYDLAKLKLKLTNDTFNPATEDKNECINFIIHSADISNCLKPWEISQ